mmetsp:Transcript_86888/g.230906  ORF Transcript_86888/g.230906 Transcript_86888/m.230906 type:complete len:302 (+) Transcript_86888:668-1573(+)
MQDVPVCLSAQEEVHLLSAEVRDNVLHAQRPAHHDHGLAPADVVEHVVRRLQPAGAGLGMQDPHRRPVEPGVVTDHSKRVRDDVQAVGDDSLLREHDRIEYQWPVGSAREAHIPQRFLQQLGVLRARFPRGAPLQLLQVLRQQGRQSQHGLGQRRGGDVLEERREDAAERRDGLHQLRGEGCHKLGDAALRGSVLGAGGLRQDNHLRESLKRQPPARLAMQGLADEQGRGPPPGAARAALEERWSGRQRQEAMRRLVFLPRAHFAGKHLHRNGRRNRDRPKPNASPPGDTLTGASTTWAAH